jgi:hypothetical protein
MRDVPLDTVGSATALARLVNANHDFRDAQELRRQAIIDAVQVGIPLREVADAAGCSHESVRRIVAADGVVVVELRRQGFPLTKEQVELLIYKLAGYGAGRFPRDVELLAAGDGWLPAAAKLAAALQSALSEESVVKLDPKQAFALHQVLRLTRMTIPSSLASLAEALSTGAR